MKAMLFAAAGTMVACNSDSAAIMKRLDALEATVKQRCSGGGGAQQQPQREEPAPDATFAVDVRPNVALGMVEGPNTACVTLVEAWDFA